MSTTTTTAAASVSPAERKQTMDRAVTEFLGAGWRIETRSDYEAVFVKGHRHSHGLHLFLTIITGGLWGLFVWLPLSVFGGERRQAVWVDELGQRRGR